MRRWGWWVVSGVVVVVVAVGAAYSARTAREARLKQSVRDAGYREQIEKMRAAYPKGTPRLVVEKGLGLTPWSNPKLVEEELVLGQDPSPTWRCSTLDSYAVFMFAPGPDRDAEPLVSIELEQAGGDCM